MYTACYKYNVIFWFLRDVEYIIRGRNVVESSHKFVTSLQQVANVGNHTQAGMHQLAASRRESLGASFLLDGAAFVNAMTATEDDVGALISNDD